LKGGLSSKPYARSYRDGETRQSQLLAGFCLYAPDVVAHPHGDFAHYRLHAPRKDHQRVLRSLYSSSATFEQSLSNRRIREFCLAQRGRVQRLLIVHAGPDRALNPGRDVVVRFEHIDFQIRRFDSSSPVVAA
jgi:hypothetical protein